jgi:hypothetical protein
MGGMSVKGQLMRSDHWVMRPGENPPIPVPKHITREAVVAAARRAIRCATSNGTELDFDPDALVIELCNGLFLPRGLGHNPKGAAA